MAVNVSFEIGHTIKLKSKKTPEGFTHDWELYVRGVEKNDISHFVDKVVFNLHDSFPKPKPKRTYKEAPYIIKESGCAGFVLPIDIHFKNRDDPKWVQYSYDLDLQNTGSPVHRSVVKNFIFHNPSEEFKQKLLKGGGYLLIINNDEKSIDSAEERSKPKATIEAIKKHKIRADDSKIQTFATPFGTPLTKTSLKVSTDPKSKGSPDLATSSKISNKVPEKSLAISTSSIKEKSEKVEKKYKYRRNSPHKDSKTAPNDEKHERKDEKVKEKSHLKDRDRALKRLISPKKTISLLKSSSAAGRKKNAVKPAVKADVNIKKISSNSGKNSKEKKSCDKDKDHGHKERDRERKEKEDRSSCNSVSLGPTPVGASLLSLAKAPATEPKLDPLKKEGQSENPKDLKKVENKAIEIGSAEKKALEKHAKDSEKKHKHKKKDVSSKNKKKEKSSKQKDENRKVLQPSPQMSESFISAQQKSNSNSGCNSTSKLSDQESSDSENESSLPVASEFKQNNNHLDTSNSSFPDLVVPKRAVSHFEEVKPENKEHKSREKTRPKESKQRKRRNKDDLEPYTRKSVSPIVNPDLPPNKQIKKEEVKDEKPRSPLLSGGLNSSQAAPHDASPHITNSSPVFRTPSSAPISGSLGGNNSSDQGGINVNYMSELRELQHKIMTLQDNNELQQVVEMIAATGRFEVTTKTFAFDLCALDRTTVQRLQDFLATSI